MADLPDEPVEYLRLAVPPGWIELKAFSDDDTASAWFDALLDETPDLVDGAGRARLQEVYRRCARRWRRTPSTRRVRC